MQGGITPSLRQPEKKKKRNFQKGRTYRQKLLKVVAGDQYATLTRDWGGKGGVIVKRGSESFRNEQKLDGKRVFSGYRKKDGNAGVGEVWGEGKSEDKKEKENAFLQWSKCMSEHDMSAKSERKGRMGTRRQDRNKKGEDSSRGERDMVF